jgi:hypothetical protein
LAAGSSCRTEPALSALAPRVTYGVGDLGHADTTPGAACWCAPPVELDRGEYLPWLRLHFRTDPGLSQRMGAVAWYFARGGALDVTGPYASDLLEALAALAVKAPAVPQTAGSPGRKRRR